MLVNVKTVTGVKKVLPQDNNVCDNVIGLGNSIVYCGYVGTI